MAKNKIQSSKLKKPIISPSEVLVKGQKMATEMPPLKTAGTVSPPLSPYESQNRNKSFRANDENKIKFHMSIYQKRSGRVSP